MQTHLALEPPVEDLPAQSLQIWKGLSLALAALQLRVPLALLTLSSNLYQPLQGTWWSSSPPVF